MSIKKWSKFAVCLVITLLSVSPLIVHAQESQNTATEKRVLPTADREEYRIYNELAALKSPEEILSRSESFLAEYKSSDLRPVVYHNMVLAAIRLNNLDKTFEIAKTALSEFPDHILVLTQPASTVASQLMATDSPHIDDAEEFAKKAILLIEQGKMPYGYKLSQWRSYKSTLLADLYQATGAIALKKEKLEDSIKMLGKAAFLNPSSAYLHFLLGRAQVKHYQNGVRTAVEYASSLKQPSLLLEQIAHTYTRALSLTESENQKSLRASIEYDMQTLDQSLDTTTKAEFAKTIAAAKADAALVAKPPAPATGSERP
ncbi:MAG: hypothetical protein JNN15_01920 [Blastocatellia bacterium]|nr:hypothetical protein [Blastocatellia bacterium]